MTDSGAEIKRFARLPLAWAGDCCGENWEAAMSVRAATMDGDGQQRVTCSDRGYSSPLQRALALIGR